MKKIYIQYHKTILGELILGSTEKELCICDWKNRESRTAIDNRIKKKLNTAFEEKETDIIKKAKKQIDQYISGNRKEFNIPLKTAGTSFQEKVWNELLKIPSGKTYSYLDISKKINNEKAVRAVSSAIKANALSLFIPCHRVIGSDGSLTGYAGGVDAKRKLLKIESENL